MSPYCIILVSCLHISVSFNFHHTVMMTRIMMVLTSSDTLCLVWRFVRETLGEKPGWLMKNGFFFGIIQCLLIYFWSTPWYLPTRCPCPQLIIVLSACYKNHQREHGEPEQQECKRFLNHEYSDDIVIKMCIPILSW